MRERERERVHQRRKSASDTCFNDSSLASQKCWRQSRAQGDERDEPRVRTRKSLGRARLAHNLTDFQAFLGRLQQPGGYRLLPAAPQRLYHPVKGQLTARDRRVEANAIG